MQFQVILVSDKSFADYLSVALKLENDYLASKFGPNKMVQALARDAILTENVGFAKDLNKALKVLGHKSDEKVLENLCVKYRTFASQYYRNYGFQRIINKVDGDNSKYNEKKEDPKEPEEENTNSHKMFYFNEINPLVWLLGIPIGALLISLLIGSTVVKFLE